MTLVVGAQAIWEAGPQRVGGKAYRLAQLARYGFAVPPLLSVPAEIHAGWLAATGRRSSLVQAAHRWLTEQDDRALLAAQCELLSQPLPPELTRALRESVNLADVVHGYAVRSSAPHEDGPGHSFAGQYLTRLGVKDEADLELAVREVWASLWSPAAVSYRAHKDSDLNAEMAVLLMPMVQAQASGVGLTRDPVSGRGDTIHMQAVRGLGEGLVSGQQRGEDWVLQVNPLDHHVKVREQPSGEATALTEDEAETLAGLLYQAALSLDFAAPHFDLEWASDKGGQFWLLQARPITAGHGGQTDVWTRGNIGDTLPLPLSAADWSASQVIIRRVLESSVRAVGHDAAPAELFRVRDGYLYLNLSALQRQFHSAFGLTPAETNGLLGGGQVETTVPPTHISERLQQIGRLLRLATRSGRLRRKGRQQAADLLAWNTAQRRLTWPDTDEARAEVLRSLVGKLSEQDALFFLQGGSGGGVWALRRVLGWWRGAAGEALALSLLSGAPAEEGSVSAQHARALLPLAHLLRRDEAALEWVRRVGAGDTAALPDTAWAAAWKDYLDLYGHRATLENYVRHPRWREEPTPLLQQLLRLVEVEEKPCLTPQPRSTVPWLLRPLVKAAQQELRDRELGRSAAFSTVEPYRRFLLQLGAEWQRRGWLRHAADPFDLTWPELHALLAGVRSPAGLPALIADRQKLRAEQERRNPPFTWTEGKQTPQSNDQSTPAGRTLRGTPASLGKVSGRACVLQHPSEVAELRAGDIIIAPQADPAWTPLFLQAGGLVLEMGGLLSHAVIVAREFGLPTLVGVPQATQHIQTGDIVQLDASAGTLHRLSSARSTP